MAARVPAFDESGIESPVSENSQTRFSTPVSGLDDHRGQDATRPRTNTVSSLKVPQSPENSGGRPQHPTQISTNTLSPDLLQINDSFRDKVSSPKNSEHAIIDDDKSIHDGHVIDGSECKSPVMPRRSTVRQYRKNINKSRESSTSSSSSSEANSVDAFADPTRRARAGTLASHTSSILELGVQRTLSGGTHPRRPTITSGSVRSFKLQDDRASLRSHADEDICFPSSNESNKTTKIDFEELDEWVAEREKPQVPHNRFCRQKLSFSSHGQQPRVFNDLCGRTVPQIITQSASPLKLSTECVEDGSDTVLNEKLDSQTDAVLGIDEEQRRWSTSSEPTRYSFFSSELEQTIHAADFEDLLTPGDNFRDLFELPEDGGVWWLDINDPTEEELRVFQRAFGIHRLTVEDVITQETREKVELFKQYYFVCFRSFCQMDEKHEDYMEPVNVYMVVFREGIITITYKQSPHAGNVRGRIGKLRDYMTLTTDWICYAMIDNIVDAFGPPIHNIEVEADAIEDQVYVARDDDFADLLRQISHCRKTVTTLSRLLGGKADVIKGFAKRCNEQYSITPRGDIGLYLGDIQDHVVTMMSNLGHFDKMLSRSHSNYLAQISVNTIATGNRANEVLSKITVLASILVPLNLICGLFGMNVNVPGKQTDGLGWFFGIIGAIAMFVVLALGMARRFKFI